MAHKDEQAHFIDDFSGLIQRKTNRFQMNTNEVWEAENASSEEIGSFKKRLGYTQRGDDLTTTTSTSSSTSTTTTSTSTSSSSSTTTTA